MLLSADNLATNFGDAMVTRSRITARFVPEFCEAC